MNNFLLFAPTVAYLVLLTGIAIWVVRKYRPTSIDQFAVSNRGMGRWMVTLSLAATFVGPSYSLGVVDRASTFGWKYVLLYCCAVAHLVVTAKYLIPRIRAQMGGRARTVGDLAHQNFGAVGRAIIGFLVVAQSVAFVGVLALGGAKILQATFGFDPTATTFIVTIVVILYSFTCGIDGVVRTDVLQFGFLVIIAIVAVGLAAKFVPPSPSTLGSAAATYKQISGTEYFSLLVAFLLGEALQPIYLTRAFLAKNADAAKFAFYATAVFGVIWFCILGLLGTTLAPVFAHDQQTIMLTFINDLSISASVRSFLLGLLAAGFLGVVMSTMDSVLNAGAVSLVDDLFGSVLKFSDSGRLNIARAGIVVLGILGALVASFASDFVGLLILAYTIWVPTAVPVIFYALVTPEAKRLPWSVALSAILAGVFAYLVTDWWFSDYVPPILCGFMCNSVILTGHYVGWVRTTNKAGA